MISRDTMNLMRVRRFWLSGVVLVAVLVLVPFSFHAERHLETATRIEGSEAGKVPQELDTRFRSPFVDRVVLVIQGLPPVDSEEGEQALATVEKALQEEPGVSGVVSRLDFHDQIFLGKGGGTFVLVGLASTEGPVESLVPKLHELERSLQNQFRGRYPGVKLELTGETPLNFDIRKASADDVQHAESLVIPGTLALLLLAFGSLVAALIPVAVGQLAIASALAIAGFLARRWHLSILVQNLSTMLGLGLGIDYALLMVSRFREAIATEQNGVKASAIAARQAGRTLLVAGMSVLLANPLVPAVLAALGPRINSGRVPFIASWDEHRAARTENRWRRWGKVIVAHPWLAIFLAGAPLLLLASQAARFDTNVPKGDWLPSQAESVSALHALERMDRVGMVYSLRVILELPTDSIAQTDAGWNALDRFSRRLASDPRSDHVISLTSIAASDRSGLGNLSRETRRSFLSRDGRAALIEVLPATSVSLNDQVDWVRELRKTGAPVLTGIPGATLRVGGIPALTADYQTIVRERFVSVIALVVGGTLIALLGGFRSLFAAVKAIALNLLSVAAAFGALVLVFQDGHGCRFFGVPEGTGSIFPIVPIVAFAIVFGLSMDYEVFLVARVLEARRSGLSELEAIPEGLAKTAGLITSAAAIMIVVFAAFTFGNFLVVKMLGFTLAVAVLIDATLVRIVIGPALLRVAGDWNWWPGGLTGARNAPGVANDE